MLHAPLFRFTALAAVLACNLPLELSAQSTDRFREGHGQASGGAYTGKAFGPWTSAWTVKRSSPSVGVDRDVIDTWPLVHGGGNYLQVSGVSAGPGIWGIARTFAPVPSREYNGLRRDRPHIISFQLRIDELGQWSRGEDFAIGDGHTSAENNGMGSLSSYIIRAHHSPTGNAKAGVWALYNGTRDGTFSTDNYVDTGIELTLGLTYTFTITLLPDTRSWTARIEDGTRTFTSELLGYRAGGMGTGIFSIVRNTVGSNKSTIFSVDNVSIETGW